MIEVRDLRKSYGDFEAVRGVSFEARPGGVLGILGPNGAGKTTILKVLAGYHAPTSGTVRVAGFDACEDALEIKRRVGYLPETSPLYPDLTAGEHLEFVAEARGLRGPGKAREIRKAAELCGVGDVLSVAAERLSRGYRQRVGFAAAVLGDPPVLILDEPTAGLDPNQIRSSRALIRDLGRERTVLLSTHILGEAEAICSDILILNGGLAAGRGSPGKIAESLHLGETLEAVLRGPDEGSLKRALGRLGTAGLSADTLPEASGTWRVRMNCPPGSSDEAAEAVSDWAASEGFKLLELRREKLPMEDIFARLTREGGEP